jgi:hypothetical protein
MEDIGVKLETNPISSSLLMEEKITFQKHKKSLKAEEAD